MQQTEQTTKSSILTYVLTPFSWLYGATVYLRNKFYDWGVIRSETFDTPIVSVGNLTIGGTGKTPHVEYIADRLAAIYNIAVLSRGYKRKTRGFVLAGANSTPDTIGDEPYQIYRKYGRRVKVAVCENRNLGIRKLKEIDPSINLIILDDAFQHRNVTPKVNVLLIDYTRPVDSDHLLPLGRLRESKMSRYRADMIIVTKVPAGKRPIDFRVIKKKLDLWAYQKLFFSRINYGKLAPVFEEECKHSLNIEALKETDTVLLLSGIANPRPFIRHFKHYPCKVTVAHFPDHHNFTRADIKEIEARFSEIKGRKVIITTEKDAVRLAHNPYFPEHLKQLIFYLPISVDMLEGIDGADFIGALRSAINATAPAPQTADNTQNEPTHS
ncbi:MAG: tetraacyldisaccharide 4'-kinase [Prevotella sp.]|nr:tetraacyldisaccharide 4'-kinase [Prevotella sp.]MCM1074663.1 tetraacyldisaccharide 4'-kinase [Ruminococcus sp.]